MASKKTKARKYQLAEELADHFDNYSRLFIVECDNVGSDQIHGIRRNLRGKALLYCGKNTQMRRVIRQLEENGRPELDKVRQACKLNVALIFTNEDLVQIRDAIIENKKPSAAKAGAAAQCDVTIPKGLTGLEPSMTAFLQALNISSKITKGSIEIINDVELLKTGQKIDASQAALLQKLEITPFEYGLVPLWVFDQGSLFAPDVLDIEDSRILGTFSYCLKETAKISLVLEKGWPTVASVPFSILLAFKDLLAFAAETEFSFEQAQEIKAYLADPSAFAVAAVPTAGSATTTAAAVVEEEEEEEEEMAAGPGLFDEGDDY